MEAEPGDFITIARRQKNSKNWFIGGITDENARTTILDFNFLEKGKKYNATIYKDGDNADYLTHPESYTIEKKTIDANSKLSLILAKGGGFAISLSPVQ